MIRIPTSLLSTAWALLSRTSSKNRLEQDLELVRKEFNPEFYRRKHYEGPEDPFQHYLTIGWLQGNDPNDWFSTTDYLRRYPDVRRAKINPLVHYVLKGRTESRPITAPEPVSAYELIKQDFDADYYATRYPDVQSSAGGAIRHYMRKGWKEGRNPNAKFDTAFYLETNPDVKKAGINPFYHYLAYGKKEGRRPSSLYMSDGSLLLTDIICGKATPPTADAERELASVVIPIYNNFEDVSTLLPSLQQTVPDTTSVILVNDCSPDDRIAPLLASWAQNNKNWRVLTNEKNIGFAHSVNLGMRAAAGHVVVVNSDIILPAGWLDRILAPIKLHPGEVGSVTPFSNHSSFTGFPHPRSELPVSEIGGLEQVDAALRMLKPQYMHIPAGVGFCMAMNRAAIDRVGVLDADAYGRGYYEDTDWSQRALIAGFQNVVCDNLFVHHKVGSKSFSVVERNDLSRANRKIFLDKYPYFERAEQNFYETDPLKEVRFAAQATAWRQEAASAHLIIDHSWGGGANLFANRMRDRLLAQGSLVIEVVLEKEKASIAILYRDRRYETQQVYTPDLWKLAEHFAVDQVVLNGVHGSNQLHKVLNDIAELALTAPVDVYIHDFLAVCPTIFLLTDAHKFCGIPDMVSCHSCFYNNRNIQYPVANMVEWRRHWRRILSRARAINLFSASSKAILLRAYPSLDPSKLHILGPDHTVNIQPVKPPRLTRSLRIGVIGSMRLHKGSRVVLDLAEFIKNNNYDADITVVGSWHDSEIAKPLKILGAYDPERLVKIVEQEKLQVILFPSVCPETYSWTLSEVFAMRLPVVGLDLGAQGERISGYEYGVTAQDANPEIIFSALKQAYQSRWTAESAELLNQAPDNDQKNKANDT